MQSISFIKQTVSEEKIFKDFFRKFVLLGPQQPIKIIDQDEGHLKRRALLNKHFSKNKTQISPMRKQKFAISIFSIISLWDVKVAMATRILIRSEQKTTFWSPPSVDALCQIDLNKKQHFGPHLLWMLYAKYQKFWPHSFRGDVI